LGSDAGDVDACCAECEAASSDALGASLTLGTFAISVGINVSVTGASVEAIGNLLLSKAAAGHRGLGTNRPEILPEEGSPANRDEDLSVECDLPPVPGRWPGLF
jgi:hypothetical protein